jgi:hypothetical protein
LDLSVTNFTKNTNNMNKNTKLILMAGGAVALTYALMEYYKKNVKGDATGTPTVPNTDPMRASSFTASDDFFSNYVSDDFFGFTANETFMNAGGGKPSLASIVGIKSKAQRKFTPKPKSVPIFSRSKGNKETGLADLQFTASDNFFNAGGVPIATDEPNFKF